MLKLLRVVAALFVFVAVAASARHLPRTPHPVNSKS
jgi:hypothetical protein